MARTADSQPSTGTGVPALVPHGRFKGKPAMPLGRPVTIIGARTRSHLHLVSPAVSKSHAMIVNTGAGLYLRDLASRTHVHVNGQRVREADLREGDILGVGPFTFRFTDAPGGDPPRRSAGPAPAVLRSQGRNLPLPINARTLLIGRRPTCDLVLEELDVSTTHAVIFQMSGTWFVRDLGSRTGTHINGTAVHQQPLEFGDAIRIGEQEMTLVAASDAGAPALDELEDLAGTAPLAGEEPLDLIFEDEPADAPAVAAPTSKGRAMPPAVPPARIAPAAAAETEDDGVDLELAPPASPPPPSRAAVVAPSSAVAPIPLDDVPAVLDELAVAEVQATPLAPIDLGAEPVEAAHDEFNLDEPAAAPAGAEPKAAEASEPGPAGRAVAPDIEAADLIDGPGQVEPEPAAAAAAPEAAAKAKKRGGWRRLFGGKKDAEPAAPQPAAEAPRPVAEELPRVDLDELEPAVGAAAAPAEPLDLDNLLAGEPAPPGAPEVAATEVEPADLHDDSVAAASTEPDLEPVAADFADEILTPQPESVAAEPEREPAEFVSRSRADAALTFEPAGPDVAADVVGEPELELEAAPIELATEDAAADIGAQPGAPHALADALELEPAAPDAVEVLDKTEPTPESALDLDAALPPADAGHSLEDDEPAAVAGVAAVEEDALTDSVFGREVEAFQGGGLGPIVEAGPPADEPTVAGVSGPESLSDELDLVAEPEPTLGVDGETTPVADAPEEAPLAEAAPELVDAEEEEPRPASAAAPTEVEAAREEPLDLATSRPEELGEPAPATASAAAEPDYGLDFLDAPATDESVFDAPVASADDEPQQAVEVAPEPIDDGEPAVAEVAAAAPQAVIEEQADDRFVAESFPLDEAGAEEGVAEAVAENEPAVDASPVELSEAPVVPVVEAGETSTPVELVEAAGEVVTRPAGQTESTPVFAAARDGAAPATGVLGTPPADADWAAEPAAVVDARSELPDEPLDLASAEEGTAQPAADEPLVITGEILDAELESAPGPEAPLVFEAGEAGAPGGGGTVSVTELEPDLRGTGPIPAAGAVEPPEPADLGEPEFSDGAAPESPAPGAAVATPSSLAGSAPSSAPPAPADMFFGLQRDSASFMGGMPLRLPPLRGPFAEQTRVDFRGSAAQAAGRRAAETRAEGRPADDDEAADEPELLLDLSDDSADVGAADAPPASSADSVAAALAPAEPGRPPRPPQSPPRGRAEVNPFGPIDMPGDEGGTGAPARGRMIAGPFDMNFEDAPTDDIEIPPFDGPRPAGGGGGRSTPGQVTTAFDGLAMPPVRQADVFSQTPLSSVAIPPFNGGGGVPAAPSADRGRQPKHDDFDDDDDAPLDLGFADEDAIPPARARDDNNSNPDLELGEWEDAAAAPPRCGAERGGASRRPPAYPAAADPASGRPAPAKKKRWRIGKWGLFGLMLVCMAGATAAIALGLPRLMPNQARVIALIKFEDRFASLPQMVRRKTLDEQRATLESAEVRALAREIAQKKYNLPPGFLLGAGGEPRHAARAYSQLVHSARLAEKRPAIELEHASADPAGDKLRMLALLDALYAANKPLLDEEGRLKSTLDSARADLTQAIADRKALQPAISAAQKELGETDVVSARRADVEMLRRKEQELSAKWDKTTARVRALLADVRTSETATAPPDPDADPERLPPLPQEDEQVVEMDRQLKELTATLAEKKRQRTAQAEEASKALQASLQEFEDDIKRARGSMQPDSELGRYLASADKVQSQLREMSLDLQQQQQSDMQRLTELKRKLADKNEARIRAAFAGDSKLQQLSEALAVADRQFHAAKGGGLRDDAAELEKEVAALRQQIADRQDLLTTADGISPEVTELPAIIDDMLARMDADRARNDRRMAEMLKGLASQAPAAGSLPAEQKAFAQQLEARQSELNKARQRYAAAMEAAGAAADAEVREAEAQLAALQAKIDERKKQVAEATRATLSEEQQTARAAATQSRKQELARAEEEDKAAEAAFYENRRLLGDAQHALSLVQKDSEEFDRLNRQAVALDGEITALNKRLDELRQTRDAGVSPVAPIEDHVAVIGAGPDRRWEYALATNFALGAVFFVLVLMAPGASHAGDGAPGAAGDAGDAGADLPFASAAGAPPRGRNGDGAGGDRRDTPEREDEPLVV